jgi:hypothetical protein
MSAAGRRAGSVFYGSFPPWLCENALICYDRGLIWEADDGAGVPMACFVTAASNQF